jgi:hypothetical protein
MNIIIKTICLAISIINQALNCLIKKEENNNRGFNKQNFFFIFL